MTINWKPAGSYEDILYQKADGIARVLLSEPNARVEGPDGSTEQPKLLTENLVEEDIKDVAKYGYYGGWLFEGRVPKEVVDEIGGNVDHRGMIVLRRIRIGDGYIAGRKIF